MITKQFLAIAGWGFVVVAMLPSLLAARDLASPGFEAAWAEVTDDGRLFYHCLVDLRNCEADELDLVVQFLFANGEGSNLEEQGSDEALMLFPQTWQRATEASASSQRWVPEPVELKPSLFLEADLKPGIHDVDAVFDLYDVKARKYVAGGWPWRLTLRVRVAVDGTVTVTPLRPGDEFLSAKDPSTETAPPVVIRPTPIIGDEPMPRELSAYELKPVRLYGTMRLRHGAELSQVDGTPDGTTLVSVGKDRSLCIWKGEQGSLKHRLRGSLLKASNGVLRVLDTTESTILLDPATGLTVSRMRNAPTKILAAGLSIDASRLILLSETTIEQWDATSGERLSQYATTLVNQFQTEVTGSISRCGRYAVLACNAGKINNVVVFEVSSGRAVMSTIMDHGVAPSVAVCATGKYLALPDPSNNGRNTLAIFDAASGEKRSHVEIGYSQCPFAVSPDGSLLAMVDNTSYLTSHLVFCDPSSGSVRRITGPGAFANQLAFSPDGTSIAIAGGTGVEVVDVATGQVATHWAQPASAVAFSADGQRIITGDLGGRIEVRDATRGTEILGAAGLGQAVGRLATSSDGRYLAACTERGEYVVWNSQASSPVFSAHAHRVQESYSAQLDLSPDARRLVTCANGGGDPLVWDIEKGKIDRVLSAGGEGADCVAFSPDGNYAAACHVAGDASSMTVWELSTRQPKLRENYKALIATFSQDGNRLFIAPKFGKSILQYLWNEGKSRNQISLPEVPKSLACNRDGSLIASAGYIFDANTGDSIIQHEKVSEVQPDYLFEPNGRHLLAIAEGQLHVFESTSGKRRRTVAGPWHITAAAFTPDGKTLLTGLCNGAVVAWEWRL